MKKHQKQYIIEDYQRAVWDFMVEHCDLTKNGAMFVKFHTDGRADLERRINARLTHKYHRGDPVAREEIRQVAQETFKENKKRKKEVWRASAKERRKVFDELKKANRPDQSLSLGSRLKTFVQKSLSL